MGCQGCGASEIWSRGVTLSVEVKNISWAGGCPWQIAVESVHNHHSYTNITLKDDVTQGEDMDWKIRTGQGQTFEERHKSGGLIAGSVSCQIIKVLHFALVLISV